MQPRPSLALVIFTIQEPTDAQVLTFKPELRRYISSRCPNFAISDSALIEMVLFVHTVISLQRQRDPGYARELTELKNMQTYTEICEAAYLNQHITTRLNLAMFYELLPQLHEKYGFRQMVAFTRAYRQEYLNYNGELPLPLINPVDFSIDDIEAEYQGVGEQVKPAAFCKPAETVPKDADCSICITKIDCMKREEEKPPELTKCGHVFHELCLDKWVNDSAMKASNTCPSCRAVMRKPRRRIHTSQGGVSLPAPTDGYEPSEMPGVVTLTRPVRWSL